ncbi:MAG: hypothetical protein ACEQSB_04300 [Undibacterium sp.]
MFNPFGFTVSYWDTFWRTYFSQIEETQFRQEMVLQLEIACPGKPEDGITPHDIQRLEAISAAARAFLAQNRPITGLNQWPLVRAWEETQLRQFIRQFLLLERELARRAGLSSRHWRKRHERALSRMVAANSELYGLIASGRCNEPVQQQLEASLSTGGQGPTGESQVQQGG